MAIMMARFACDCPTISSRITCSCLSFSVFFTFSFRGKISAIDLSESHNSRKVLTG